MKMWYEIFSNIKWRNVKSLDLIRYVIYITTSKLTFLMNGSSVDRSVLAHCVTGSGYLPLASLWAFIACATATNASYAALCRKGHFFIASSIVEWYMSSFDSILNLVRKAILCLYFCSRNASVIGGFCIENKKIYFWCIVNITKDDCLTLLYKARKLLKQILLSVSKQTIHKLTQTVLREPAWSILSVIICFT